jgi:hypothetical protein
MTLGNTKSGREEQQLRQLFWLWNVVTYFQYIIYMRLKVQCEEQIWTVEAWSKPRTGGAVWRGILQILI